MKLPDEFASLVDLTEVRKLEVVARELDDACKPLIEAATLAGLGVTAAEHAYRMLDRDMSGAGFNRVVLPADREAAVQVLQAALDTKAAADHALAGAREITSAGNDAVAAANVRAHAPLVSCAIDRRIANAAKFDAAKAAMDKADVEAMRLAEVLVHASRNGARLPGGHQGPPIARVVSEAQERAMWGVR